MYFALSTGALPDLAEQLAMLVQGSPTDERWFILFDVAFDHEQRQPLGWRHPVTPLYTEPQWAALSPTLLHLPKGSSADLKQSLLRVLRHASGRPMISLIQTHAEADDLARSWRPIKWVQTSDGLRLLLRLADARTLLNLPSSLSPSNWARVASVVNSWHVINRSGQLQALPMPDETLRSSSLPDAPLMLTDTELNALTHAAQPDALIQALHEQLPEALPAGVPPGQVHDWVRRAHDMAVTQGLDGSSDQLALAAAACWTHGEVLHHPALPDLLAVHASNADATATLTDTLIELLPDETETED